MLTDYFNSERTRIYLVEDYAIKVDHKFTGVAETSKRVIIVPDVPPVIMKIRFSFFPNIS